MFWPSIVVVNCGYAFSLASHAAPVVARAPVLGQLLDVVERHAVAPPDAGQLVGPAGAGEPVAQVVQVGLGISMRNGRTRVGGLLGHRSLPPPASTRRSTV